MKGKNKKNIGIVFFVILLIQIFAFNYSASIYMGFVDNHKKLQQSQVDMNTALITDTVREQQKNTLSSTKQSWIKYLEEHHNITLIKQVDGKPIYANDNTSLLFDRHTMYRVSKGNNKYDIKSRETDELLIDNSQPQWNTEEVEKILDVLVKPIKMFGNNGGIIVYDSNTGQIVLDTTSTQRLRDGEQHSIFEDDKHSKNKNVSETKEVIENFFKLKRDSNRVSSIIYMFNESTIMGNDASNFSKYPLGEYNRQFIESAVLPYESVGFEGQPLQLTMLSVVDEKDITTAYQNIYDDIEESLRTNMILYGKTSIMLVTSIICTMIVMLFSLYKIKYKDE